jgi:amino acid adenylation domain-containing protein
MSHSYADARASCTPPAVGIYALVSAWAERTPAAAAIAAPGRTPLTYSRLHLHMVDVLKRLNAVGLGRNDCVALVLPQGPEMAVAFLAVATGATCVPLNPAYRTSEFAVSLAHLRTKALIVQSEMDSPARAAAQAHGIPIIELSPAFEAEAGVFTLSAGEDLHVDQAGLAQPNDVALMLLTSGTTARPKLVPLTQTNICTVAHNIQAALQLVERDRCLNVMPLFHAHGLIIAMLSSLAAGGSVVCTPSAYAPKFFEWLEECGPTWYTAAPTMHQAVLANAVSKRQIIERCPLRFIRSSASALPRQVIGELESVFHVPVIESYGMTECAQITCNPLPPHQRKLGSVGIAAGPEVAIVDETGAWLPPGKMGEIVIRGTSVVQDYENYRSGDESPFIDDWLRTGDQGFVDTDGYLFVTGRYKEIINRGGEKISPLEIEEVLMDHPAVGQVVTFAVPHARLGEDVAAAVVLRTSGSATEREMREFAAIRLADFKVPSQVIFVDELPKGPTGKLQRIGLAEKLGIAASHLHTREGKQATAGFVHPRTPLETELAKIWAQVLGLEQQVGAYDNFFELGGDSVVAGQLISRVCNVTQVQLSMLSLFEEASTVAGMAESVEGARQAEGNPQLPPIGCVSRSRDLVLSFAQEQLWLLDQLAPGMAAYNIPKAFRLTGPLDVTSLAQSLQEIIKRHEALRTTFTAVDGRPVQIIASTLRLTMSTVDLRGLPEVEREAKAQRLAIEEAQQPFDLEHGPLLRATVLQLGEQDHIFLLTMHHIVSDGWSMGVLFGELAVLYKALSAGKPSPLPELPIQYADFAHWQRQWLQGEVLKTQLAYWTKHLAGDLPVLQLRADRPRSAVHTFSGSKQSLELSPSLTKALKVLSLREGTTLYMTLLAAFKTLLYRYTGMEDVLVGSPISNRNRIEVEGLIGFFVNTLLLRTDLSGTPSFRELLARVRKVALEAYAHQHLPFEDLIEALQPARSLSHPPFFQAFFTLLNVTDDRLELSGLTLTPLEFDTGTAKFDLTLAIVEEANRLTATMNYNTHLFDAATIARMLGHFQTLLSGIVANPDQRLSTIPLLTTTERSRQAQRSNRVQPAHPFVEFPIAAIEQSISDRFAQQVQTYPQHIAVKTRHYEWTYEVLNRRVQEVAHTLLSRCSDGEERIALLFEHDAPMLAGILGVLAAGKTYVPLDPTYPRERLAYMLDDCQASAILTHTRQLACAQSLASATLQLINVDELVGPAIGETIHLPIAPDALAYILYTSGSTGQPKGVMQNHRNVLHFIQVYTNNLHISANDRLSLFSSYSFDAAIMDIFGALLNGATLYPIAVRDEGFDEISTWLRTHEITIYHSTPTVYRYVVSTLNGTAGFPQLRLIVLGGEAVYKRDVELYKQYFSPECLFINGLGPTESTVSLQYCIDQQTEIRRNAVPVGYPVERTEVCLLDEVGQPTEITGEIALRSPHLALGYWQKPQLTQAVFLPDPEGGNRRMYRTGDLGRWLPEGGIEFLGRRDFQVKVRGYRIEVSEIETRLLEHGAIREVVVLAQEHGAGDTRLVAYAVLKPGQALPMPDLREFLRQRLPDYMVPSAFVPLDALPLTPNGKIDRRALPAPDGLRPELEAAYVAPRSPTEEMIARIWAEILAIEQVGIHDSFFQLGGHSLLATRVISRVRTTFQVALPLRRFFEDPTVAGLAVAVTEHQAESVKSDTLDSLLAALEGYSDEEAQRLLDEET